MRSSRGITISVILFCQFNAALSALGIPPFFALFLKKSFGSDTLLWGIPVAGFLFVVPTFFSGITSPFWGRMADRYGKKRLLLRAQLGLALSFLVAGYSKTAFQFFLALLVQGLLGGTFAASKAYLATFLEGESLARGLTWLESSARAALVLGPFLVGYLMASSSPVEIYRYLAILPIFSAALTVFIPADTAVKVKKCFPGPAARLPLNDKLHGVSLSENNLFTPQLVMGLQFILGTSAVIISPYFNLAVVQRFSYLSHSQLGLIFGLPHLTYLACATPLSKALSRNHRLEILIAAFSVQAISILGQAQTHSLIALISYRVISGAAITVIFIILNSIISNFVTSKTSGVIFGRLESSVRLSSVLGGLIASVCFGYFGTLFLFQISSATLAMAAIYLLYLSILRRKESLV